MQLFDIVVDNCKARHACDQKEIPVLTGENLDARNDPTDFASAQMSLKTVALAGWLEGKLTFFRSCRDLDCFRRDISAMQLVQADSSGATQALLSFYSRYETAVGRSRKRKPNKAAQRCQKQLLVARQSHVETRVAVSPQRTSAPLDNGCPCFLRRCRCRSKIRATFHSVRFKERSGAEGV